MAIRLLAIAAAWALSCGSAFAAHETTTLDGVAVDVWTREGVPQSGDPVREPVIVFSHGFHGCATQSRFLMEAFASAGYFVVAPNHRDASCRGGLKRLADRLRDAFQRPASWTDESFRDRADDIRRVIAALENDERFADRVDLSRLALAGHSLGGYTVLGLAGAWRSWHLPHVKAVLALSPYSQPFLVQDTLGGLTVPVMYQGGTLDFGVLPELRKNSAAFDLSPEPKYFVNFYGATHFVWTNLGLGHRNEIVAYSLAFMDHYVRGERAADVLTQRLPGVADYRYASELGQGSM